jgi:hypothetical protein
MTRRPGPPDKVSAAVASREEKQMSEGRRSRRRPGTDRPRKKGREAGSVGPDRRLALGTPQLLVLLGGLVAAVAGFWVLSTGSINLAPALLVIAYLVLIPVALVLLNKPKGTGPRSSDS